MSTYLKKLSDIGKPDLTKLAKSDMVQEIIDRIKADPRWSELWDGELLQNDSYMLINFFAYLIEKDLQYTNKIVRETIPTLAKDPNNILAGMSIRNIDIKQAEGAEAIVEALLENNFLNSSITISRGTIVSGKNLDGNNISFELWNVLPSYFSPMSNFGDNQKIDYFSDIVIQPGENFKEIHAFAGTTKSQIIDLQLNNSENFIINLQNEDIINSSIRIYYSNDGGLTLKELNRVNTFSKQLDLSDPEFPEGKPNYIIKFGASGSARIIFGSKEFGGYFPSPLNKQLYIYYRTGGGIKTNIVANSINTNLVITTPGNVNITLKIYNRHGGGGGQDREDINITQNLGPLRYGRDESISQPMDAILALTGIALKHKVDTPKYSEINNKVQLLHYHNYIVPKRTFDDFIFNLPIPEELDNINSYYDNKFLPYLNQYLNLSGLKDGKILDEFIKYHDNNIFSTYRLYSQDLLNGSLELNAYNDKNQLIDRLYFKRNYDGSLIIATPFESKAFVSSSNEISNVVINNSNRILRIQIDEGNPIVDLEIVSENNALAFGALFGRLNYDLANRINEVIKTNNTYRQYFISFDQNHKFCYIDEKTGILYLQSPSSGYNSIIKVFDCPNSILDTLKIKATAKKAFPDSGRVFSSSSTYNSANKVINININESLIDKKFDITNELVWPDPQSSEGPILIKSFFDYDDMTPIKMQLGIGSIIIQATNTPLNANNKLPETINVVDEIRFDITEKSGIFTANNTQTSPFYGTVFDINQDKTFYDYDNAKLTISLVEDPGDSIPKFASYNTTNPFILNVNNVDNLKEGMEVVGDDIIPGATIISINSVSKIVEINLPVTITNIGNTINFLAPPYNFTNTFLDSAGGYNKNTKFRIMYKQKLYDALTVNYIPNPYLQDAEAGMIMKHLRADDKNMIGMVPLIKKIKFNPFMIKAIIEALPGKSLNEIEINTRNLIKRFYSFSSEEETQNIGIIIPAPQIQSLLNDSVRYNPGVAKVTILEPNDILNLNENEYSFIFDDDVINRLIEFEQAYSQIKGMIETYLKNDLVFKFIK